MASLAWMAWTWQTGMFFGLIGLVLATMTMLAIMRPETPRRGVLQFPTTRGDRLFVTLLGTAVIYVLWIAFGSDALWPPAVAAVLFGAAMFRWG